MSGYTPLFNEIVTSSIWNESNPTRVVWITMLALADKDGVVNASVSGLAPVARVTLEECEKAIEVLSSPDKYSRSKEHDGRRVLEIDGGFQVLNHKKYREKAKSRAEYMRNYRRNKDVANVTECNSNVTECDESVIDRSPTNANANANANTVEEEVLNKKKATSTTSSEEIIKAWRKLPLPHDFIEGNEAAFMAIERQLSVLSKDINEPVHHGSVLEAIQNYGKALSLPDTQAHLHKLYPFLQKHVRSYISYNFNIENYKKSNFRKEKQIETSQEQYDRLKKEGKI